MSQAKINVSLLQFLARAHRSEARSSGVHTCCSCFFSWGPYKGLESLKDLEAHAWQGGRFDHADRLFGSIAAAWQNCLVNSSDVKELTPEFFYLPNFLVNADSFCLGQRQVGQGFHLLVLEPCCTSAAFSCIYRIRHPTRSLPVYQ